MSDSSMFALIARLSRDLASAGVPHALTGSVASGIHGEPITSLDVDIVARMTPEVAVRMAKHWGQELCALEESFRNAAHEHGMANLLHLPSGLKVDISMLSDTPYHQELLQRRIMFTPPGGSESFWVVTPEDIVLMKLIWHKDTQSQKQWENACGVLRVQGMRLDWKFLRTWASKLGMDQELSRLTQQAGI